MDVSRRGEMEKRVAEFEVLDVEPAYMPRDVVCLSQHTYICHNYEKV